MCIYSYVSIEKKWYMQVRTLLKYFLHNIDAFIQYNEESDLAILEVSCTEAYVFYLYSSTCTCCFASSMCSNLAYAISPNLMLTKFSCYMVCVP